MFIVMVIDHPTNVASRRGIVWVGVKCMCGIWQGPRNGCAGQT